VKGASVEKADIPYLSVTELSRLIEARQVSPVEATQAYLERIDALDSTFNSYITVCSDEALEAAGEAERDILQGNYLGPMHGIPVAVKDQLWTRGIRSTGGSRLLTDFVPDEDATVVANLKRAGAIMLGKTNLTEFAIGGPHQYGIPRNPWNTEMRTGSSSSGSGAATAAFLCATSIGEDTGGSVRFPAAWCGVVGMRPSWGRVSRYGVMTGVWSMDTPGPISRTVEDAAVTLSAISGHDPKDDYSWNAPVPDYRQALDGNVRGVKIGLVTDHMNSELVDGEVREAVVKATAVLGEMGASVEEVSLPLTSHSLLIQTVLMAVEPALNHRDWVRNRLGEYGRELRIGHLTGSIMPAQAYYKAQKLRSLVREQILKALEKFELLVLPTHGKTAQRIDDQPVTGKHPVMGHTSLLTFAFALAGMPAISVPCGFSDRGLPIGLQIGGMPGGDDTVMKVAHSYEQATPWHTMNPPNA